MATKPEPRGSRFWSIFLRIEYRLLQLLDPLIRLLWRGYGLGNVVELRVRGRRTGAERRVLLGLLRVGEAWYLGHPNGDVAWTRNLEAAGAAELVLSWPSGVDVMARRLPQGEERTAAIIATNQHPFPGNLVYRLARRHNLAVGTYFAIERPSARPADRG
jgi:hypothetical protein